MITPELYTRCRTALLKCSQFDDDASLRTLFVSELRIYRDRLPQAHNKADRVDQTLDYLMRQRLQGNRLVLPLFLTTIRDRLHQEEALYEELDELALEVEQALRAKTGPVLPQVPQQREPNWNTGAIRALLTAAFDDEGLSAFCFDYFQTVYEGFSSGMGKGQKVQRLLEYCVRQEQTEKLLSLIRKHNPAQYDKFVAQRRSD